MAMADDSFKTVAEIAAELRCSPSTINRAIRAGRIKAVSVSERVVRVPLAEYERFTGIGAAGGAGVPELSTYSGKR